MIVFLLAISLSLAFAALPTFGNSAVGVWELVKGGASPTESSFSTTGAYIRLNRAKMNNPHVGWVGFMPSPDVRHVVPEGARVQVVSRYPARGIVRSPCSMVIEDAQGEIFRFKPKTVRRTEDRVTAVYDIQTCGWQGTTEGQNRNDAFDAPLRLKSVAFVLRSDVAEGELALLSVDVVANAEKSFERIRTPVMGLMPEVDRFVGGRDCTVTADKGKIRVISTGRHAILSLSRFPGMRPFPGTEDIILRTSRSYGGIVLLNLLDPNTKQTLRIKAPWTDETHFVTNIQPNGVWQLTRLEFYPKSVAKDTFPKMDFTLDAFEGVYRATASEACRLDVDTGNALHIVRGESERPSVTLSNLSSRDQVWTGVLRCRDYFDKGFDLPLNSRVASGETVSVRLPWPLSKGIWRVSGEVAAADGSTAVLETRFAVLDEHPHTPRFQRGQVFRPGIHWHAARYSDADRRLCLEALDSCGCKLVRGGGFSFASIEGRKGICDWDIADAIMEESEQHGISLDAIIYYPPSWTQDTNRLAHARHFKRGMVPACEGSFGAFSGKLAERYGTKIDYYEIGNEWDLVPESIMTRDEAVRIHREGYAAIKRVCPAATVIPNGWTSPDVRPDHYSKNPCDRVGGGEYQAYVMMRIRDAADVYPTHMHGDYRSYHRRVRQFQDLRRQVGCGRIPWFSNETACSSVNGLEDDVARYVFQKIMCAWANGSVDYIWYNLKATGWVESDPEQGYGLMTADFYPRASYAAFSAFTTVYLGLEFEKMEIDRGTRMVCRFGGMRDGQREIVFGGWESAAVKPCPIRIRTDALSAWQVDLMGNRKALTVEDGEVLWQLCSDPSSLVLKCATMAAPNSDDLADIPVSPQSVLTIWNSKADRAPDVRLNTARQRIDFHQAIPETRHRVWQGPKDSSADVWFDRDGDDIRLRVEVMDDISAKGDGVIAEIHVAGRDICNVKVPLVGEKDGKRLYCFLFKADEYGLDSVKLDMGVAFDVRVIDDDGEGEDGYTALSVEPESLVRVRFR